MAAAGGAAIQWHPQAAAVIKSPKTRHSPQGETIVEKKALSLQGKPTDMRTAMHYTNAPALVGLSHRGSRLGFHAAAAMRQPYRSTIAGEVCYTYKTAMIAAGGLSGGISAEMAGGDFIDGFCNGLICAGLNHALHYVADGGIKAMIKNIDRFNHVRQSDYWHVKPTRCKYACLQMIENYFFGDSGRNESKLFDYGLAFEDKDGAITFFRRMACNGDNRYFVNLVNDYTPVEMAGKLEAGYPIMMIEWNGNDAHASLIIGVNEISGGDFQLQIADPLNEGASRVENWNALTQQKRTTFQLFLFSK